MVGFLGIELKLQKLRLKVSQDAGVGGRGEDGVAHRRIVGTETMIFLR